MIFYANNYLKPLFIKGFMLYLHMQKRQENLQFLMEKTALLERELARQNALIAKQESELKNKEHTVSKLTSRVDALTFDNEQLMRMIYGSKRERFVPAVDVKQLNIEFEPKTAEISEAVEQEREMIRVEYERKKTPKKSQGRMILPSHLPVVETIIEPLEDTTGMVCIGYEITKELDYVPAIFQIKITIRPKYMAKEDELGNQKQVIAELNRPIPKCMASATLLAMIFAEKYVYHLPLYRILKRFSQMGVQVPSSTLESWVKLGSQLLRPLYEVHRLHVFREVYQMVDESPIKVQDRDKPGACHQGYMWVRYAPLSKAVFFEYHKSRSTKGPIDDLHTFTGYIQTDGYAGYTHLASLQGITHLSCWAHARRYFEKALGNDKKRASHVMKLIQLLYAIEALARDKEMTPEQRHALRLEKSLPIINEIGQYIHQERNAVTPQSPIGKAFEYCTNRWISLQNYLTSGILEIDSNLVENSIRPLALGRKNYLFAGSHGAAQDIAMFYSFIGTCQKNQIDPQKWLAYAINNINDTKTSQLKNLLPQFIEKDLLK